MIKKFSQFLNIIFLLATNTFAQDKILFNHLTVESGLSQSAVTCILQDSKGFMWFGTQDGLNRYDGYSFTIFKNDPTDSNSLIDNFVFAIYEDSTGTLYVETQNGFFQKYNPFSESFTLLKKDSINVTNFRVNNVDAVLDETEILWRGNLGSETGLKRTNKKSGEVTIFKHDPSDPESIGDNKVYSLFRDHSGNLWVGTFNGLDKLNEKTGKFTHYRSNPGDPNSLSDNWVWAIFEDSKGILWIGTGRGGLNRFDPEKNLFKSYKNDPSDPTSINDNFIFSIYQGYEGLIWVGTNRGGVNFFNPATRVFEHFSHNPNDKNSLSDDAVISMCVDKDGIYWIGTRNGGLDKFNYKMSTFKNYTHDSKNNNSLVSNSISAIYQDRSGILWLGTFNSGLMAFNPYSETYKYYQNKPSDSNSLSDNRIYSILEDENGIIWIGTFAGGLNRLDRRTGKMSNYKFNKNNSTSISSDATWSLAFDDDRKLWIGTFGGGINIFDRKKPVFDHLKNIQDDPTSLADNNIIVVFKDSKGNMWAGTTKGLSRYYKEKNDFRNYSEKDGLANHFVFGITEDNKGNLWLSTNNGLSKFNPEKETFKNYYVEHGLQSNEFNQNAYAKDTKTGRILFGGINGFNIFNPDSIKDDPVSPQIVINNVSLLFNRPGEKLTFDRFISDLDELELAYNENDLRFDYVGLHYGDPSKNQYKYMLEGRDEDWVDAGTQRNAIYTNLDAGEYVFRVTSCNADGVWNEEGASLKIIIPPPFWATWWAHSLYVLFALGILYSIRQYELNRRKEKEEKRILEIENKRKSDELEQARNLQLSMLPKEIPYVQNLEIAPYMKTATEVGGDYYDFNLSDDGSLTAIMGDATGHGLDAGMMVSISKGLFSRLAQEVKFENIIKKFNNSLFLMKLQPMYISGFFIRIQDNFLQIVGAGIPPALFYQNQNGVIIEIESSGPPLGGFLNFIYETHSYKLNSGDIVIVMSDGFAERRNKSKKLFGWEQGKNILKNVKDLHSNQIIEEFIKANDEWGMDTPQDDDITILVLKVK